nr:hypothetical protein [Legionella gresilensis]
METNPSIAVLVWYNDFSISSRSLLGRKTLTMNVLAGNPDSERKNSSAPA